jgi:nitroimidazol reductase NimA-like FMN-containing flavoprotein (pyridoxamine 5'-phosphate oxidase superfamily)
VLTGLKQEKNIQSLISYLEDNRIPIRLGCMTPSGFPCVVSLWFTIIDNKIYCATKKNAKIVKYLEENPRCGFEIAADKPPYRGVRGNGTCTIRHDSGKQILETLMTKYLPPKSLKLKEYLLSHADKEVALEITPNHVSYYDYTERMKDINE